jgi:acetoin utilization deacetylase AcuC-like enzyme
MPQLILVSAGYDAHWLDPIAQMGLSVNGFAHIAKTIKNLASQLCQGRLIFTLEGGYDLQALCHSLKATLDVLLGEERIADPLGLPPQWRKAPPVCPIIEAVRERHKL